jgi:hypothetical protein
VSSSQSSLAPATAVAAIAIADAAAAVTAAAADNNNVDDETTTTTNDDNDIYIDSPRRCLICHEMATVFSKYDVLNCYNCVLAARQQEEKDRKNTF